MDLGVIQRLLRSELPSLKARYGVRSIAIFGSAVRGDTDSESDLDLLVDFDRVPSLFRFIDLEYHLQEVTGLHVDLVMREALKAGIADRALKEAVMV